ncbi:glycine cleavage system protein GcvH [Fimbriiglobus ruber]|uniref:Glycine cleavage system H protein n=1 Tax=Fimbriiglobus ruber TaxID=1908690 RepID=A0A225D4R6_9BACT|nr:glycine cleavage system protein GcvH [Fimbriiglobus ruber]OWK36570.1 Glycine cleavage system H protein [Fimbriiglobus ruber]
MDQSTLRYAKSHEWVALDGTTATIGITTFAAEQLGDITFLELPKVGKVLAAGDEIGIVESVKSTSPIYAPVSGTVTAVNDAAIKDTELIKNDSFGAGWFLKLTLAAGAGVDHLMTKAQYDEQLASEGH